MRRHWLHFVGVLFGVAYSRMASRTHLAAAATADIEEAPLALIYQARKRHKYNADS
jgi:hypothetical protein